MTTTTRISALLAGCVACGSLFETEEPAREPAPFASGSRLRAVILDGGDGAVAFLRFHDRVLDADCTFQPATDGSWRCFPEDRWATVGFADPMCRERVAFIHGAPPAHLVMPPEGFPSCHDGTSEFVFDVVAVGARTTGAFHLLAADGTCAPSFPLGSDDALYAFTPSDPGEFARAELRRDFQRDDLAVDVLVGDDGSRQAVRLFDPRRAGACKPSPTTTTNAVDAAARCLPTVRARPGLFLDSACSEPTSVAESAACGDPSISVEEIGPGCDGRDFRVWSVTPSETQVTFYQSSDGCHANASPSVTFAQGAELAKESFPALAVTLLGNGRMQAPYVASAPGARALAPYAASYGFKLWDNELSAYCTIEKFADGVQRCVIDRLASIVLPGADASAVYSRFYADSTCKGEQLANPHSGCGDPLYALVNDSSDRPVGARRVLRRYEGRTYWSTSDAAGGKCIEYGQGASDLWRVGELLQPDALFARVTERKE